MRWRGRRKSRNVVDNRGVRSRGRKPMIGIGGIVLVGLLAVAFGADPIEVITLLSKSQLSARTSSSSSARQPRPRNDTAKAFVSTVLASTEDTWNKILAERGASYREPKLVLFSDAVDSACGYTSSAVGPFYCPGDNKVYLDLGFFKEMEKMGAAGDFAASYVIAHEVGHHLQNLMGVLPKVQRAKRGMSSVEGNALQVKVELQADCYAGVWGHHANKIQQMLEVGDLEEGLAAASAVGDDTIMKRAGARVRPDAFTHGSAKSRVHWFRTGFESGSFEACDTFSN